MVRKSQIALLALAFAASAWTSGNLASSEPAPSAKPATTTWATQLTVGRFRIHSDFTLDADEPLLGELRTISNEVSQLLALPNRNAVIHVVLFANAKEYGRYIRAYYPKVPERRALYIQQHGTGMLFAHWHQDVRTDIRHEVVHGLLNDNTTTLPLWLDEGLAEYFELTDAERVYHNPHLEHVLAGIDKGYVPHLEDLERITTIDHCSRSSIAIVGRGSTSCSIVAPSCAVCSSSNWPTIVTSGPQCRSRLLAERTPNWRAEFIEHFRSIAARAKRDANTSGVGLAER